MVNSISGDKSDTVLLLTGPSPSINSFPRFNLLRLCACSSPVRSVIPLLETSSSDKFSIACVVIVSLEDSLSVCRIAAAKLASGIDTPLDRGSSEVTSIGNSSIVKLLCTSITIRDTDRLFGVKPVTNSTEVFVLPFSTL